MKILWLVPLILGERLQVTSRNELASSLKKLGHEINTIVGLRNKSVLLDGFSNIKYVNMLHGSLMKTLRFHLTMIWSVWHTDADVVIFGTSSAHLLPFAYLRKFCRNRVFFVLDIRTLPVDIDRGWRGRFQIWRYNLSIRLADLFCDGITVITPMLAHTVQPFLKRISRNVGVWSSGVRFEHFKPEGPSMRKALGLEGKKVFFYHGELSPNRGIQNAIRALALLASEIPNLAFLLVGDGAGRQEFQALARKLNISDRVIITGKVPYIQVPSYVRTADVAILPFPPITWWNVSSPIKLMEYLPMEVPVIATDIAAHRTILEKTGGGYLIPDNDPETIADCIRQLINNGKKIFVEYPRQENLEKIISWDAQATKLVTFLKKLMKNRQKRKSQLR